MEWVETTGRTIDDAKEAALDDLGVDESDAEFEVVEEPRAGLFGRLRSEARVRARVRPTAPRAKEDRRDRRRRGRAATGATGTGGTGADAATDGTYKSADADGDAATRPVPDSDRAAPAADLARPAEGNEPPPAAVASDGQTDGTTRARRRRRRGRRPSTEASTVTSGANRDQASANSTDMEVEDVEGAEKTVVPLEEQGRVAQEFLSHLTAEFGVDATVAVIRPDEDTVDLQLEGSDLGLLIGPKGTTLLAIQDLTRTAVLHKTGASNGRIHVDVGGYRRKRMDALVRFAQQVATTVQQSGQRTVLEPMSAADRKVVHDAITGIEGVSTLSEGEEPRRRVVVVPADR
jgi:spoIIIJ-associated protein